MPHRSVQIRRDNRKSYHAHLSTPQKGSGPGVLLLHEVHGLNEIIRTIANTYAAKGYVTLAPNLFWRRRGPTTFSYADKAGAEAALTELGGADALLSEVSNAFSAFDQIQEFDGSAISVVGFGLGGELAARAACFDWIRPNAGVSFNGVTKGLLALAPALQSPWLFHLTEKERAAEFRSYETSRRGRADRGDIEIISYPFVSDGFALPGKQQYDDEAAKLAQDLTFRFLSKSSKSSNARFTKPTAKSFGLNGAA